MYSVIILALLSENFIVLALSAIYLNPILPAEKLPKNNTMTPTKPTQPTSLIIKIRETTIIIGAVTIKEPY
jgi:hypothetical protein